MIFQRRTANRIFIAFLSILFILYGCNEASHQEQSNTIDSSSNQAKFLLNKYLPKDSRIIKIDKDQYLVASIEYAGLGDSIFIRHISPTDDTSIFKLGEDGSNKIVEFKKISNNKYLLVGNIQKYDKPEPYTKGYLALLNSKGDSIWSKTLFNGTFVHISAISIDQENNIWFAGESRIDESSIFVAVADLSGKLKLQKTFRFDSRMNVRDIKNDFEGNILLTYISNSNNISTDNIIKIKPNGDLIWKKPFKETNNISSLIEEIIPTQDGNYITKSKGGRDYNDFVVRKVSGKNGDLINKSIQKNNFWDCYLYQTITLNNDIYMLYHSKTEDNAIIMLKVNNSGNILWAKEIIETKHSPLNLESTSENKLLIKARIEDGFIDITCDTSGRVLSKEMF